MHLSEVGVVEVPVCLSFPLSSALFHLGRRVASDSLPLLLSRSVKKRINETVAAHLHQLFREIVLGVGGGAKEIDLPQRSMIQVGVVKHLAILLLVFSRCSLIAYCLVSLSLQLLFDVRVLHSQFPSSETGGLIDAIQSKIDPLDLSLISPYVQTNTKLAANRTQVGVVY